MSYCRNLVFRTNSVVRNQSRTDWLRIRSVFTLIYVAGLRDEDKSDDLVDGLREIATELFSLQLAVERVQARYFASECILSTDVEEGLKLPAMILRSFLEGLDQELEKSGHPERVIDCAEFRNRVDDEASKMVIYIHSVNQVSIDSLSSLRAALTQIKPHDPVVLQVERGGGFQWLAFDME
jgi:hypothetical protein